jgi:hypothetical protein
MGGGYSTRRPVSRDVGNENSTGLVEPSQRSWRSVKRKTSFKSIVPTNEADAGVYEFAESELNTTSLFSDHMRENQTHFNVYPAIATAIVTTVAAEQNSYRSSARHEPPEVFPLSLGAKKSSKYIMTEGQKRRDLMADSEFHCSPILEHLFIGGSKVATCWEILAENGITRVVNCSGAVVECCFINRANMQYKVLNMVDGREDDICWFVCEVIKFIHAGICNGENVLVHCEKGISRSCSFVTAYIMWNRGKCIL